MKIMRFKRIEIIIIYTSGKTDSVFIVNTDIYAIHRLKKAIIACRNVKEVIENYKLDEVFFQ